jgi:hypothetical protein
VSSSPQLPELTPELAFMLHNQQVMYKGWVLGLRRALGLILEARGLALSKAQKERVDSALGWDVHQLVRRALTVSSTDELFVELEPPPCGGGARTH